jgi:TPR repeat protein
MRNPPEATMTHILSAFVLLLVLCVTVPLSAQTITRTEPERLIAPEIAAARELFLAGDYHAALAILDPAAHGGDAMAQNLLGIAFSQGRGRPRDPAQAAIWLTRAAEQGEPRAMVNLGRLVLRGDDGIEADHHAARRWFQAASDVGFMPAYVFLGQMMERGLGGPVDLDAAMTLYQQAHAQGDAFGALRLGLLYRDGTGVPRDPARARDLLRVAAEAEVIDGQVALASMLEQGQGGVVDLDGARDWYRAAIGRGHAPAGFFLAQLIRRSAPGGATLTEAVSLCDWAMQRADGMQRAAWMQPCADIRKQSAD